MLFIEYLHHFVNNALFKFFKVILKSESGSVRCYPRDDIDSKAVKQIITGQYNYALNALWNKSEFKALIDKLTHEVKNCAHCYVHPCLGMHLLMDLNISMRQPM